MTNKITHKCKYLTYQKHINYYETKRFKIIPMIIPYHKCELKNKEVNIPHDCADCEYYEYIESD